MDEVMAAREYDRQKEQELRDAEYEAAVQRIANDRALAVPPRPDGDTSMGLVYFLQAQSKLIKIGFTTDLLQRRSSLRTQVGDLEILATQAGTMQLERALHTLFAEHRRHGEWFEPTESLLKYIATIREAQSTD